MLRGISVRQAVRYGSPASRVLGENFSTCAAGRQIRWLRWDHWMHHAAWLAARCACRNASADVSAGIADVDGDSACDLAGIDGATAVVVASAAIAAWATGMFAGGSRRHHRGAAARVLPGVPVSIDPADERRAGHRRLDAVLFLLAARIEAIACGAGIACAIAVLIRPNLAPLAIVPLFLAKNRNCLSRCPSRSPAPSSRSCNGFGTDRHCNRDTDRPKSYLRSRTSFRTRSVTSNG